MAKKQSLSYGPDMGLIAGEQFVAETETGVQTNIENITSIFGEYQKANEERDALIAAYEEEVGGIPNINYIDDPVNKQIIRTFLNEKKDEYVELRKNYEITKNRDVKEKMEAIKFSLANLNQQIKVFAQDKQDYRRAADEGLLAHYRSYTNPDEKDFFAPTYTQNAKFSIDPNGDLLVNVDGKSHKYKDKAGRWNDKTLINENDIMTSYASQYQAGLQGKAFNSGLIERQLSTMFKKTGNNALNVLITTDLASDNIENSIEAQFASGDLQNKEIYAYAEKMMPGIKNSDGTYKTNWMFESKNAEVVRNIASKYFTNVIKDGHTQGFNQYKPDGTDGTNPFNIHGYFTIPGSGGKKRRGEEANNLRTQIQNIVEGKIKNKIFTGYFGDYVYQTEGDNAGYFMQGDDKKSVYKVLTEEGLYYSAGEFEKSLGNLGDGGKGGGEGEINNAYNMTGDIVENGLAAGIFMQDDNAAATTLQALLPAGFVIKKGGATGAVGKFFGVDKLTITAPDGTNLGTFDFGYSDSDKALEESKRFNSNVVEGDYFRKNNIVLGNL